MHIYWVRDAQIQEEEGIMYVVFFCCTFYFDVLKQVFSSILYLNITLHVPSVRNWQPQPQL
jgi:hypothetical protein